MNKLAKVVNRKFILLYVILFLIYFNIFCNIPNNGKIINQEKICFTNIIDREYLERRNISTNDFVLYKITYLSDGLKVKGYIGKPRPILFKRPAIIFNRGGNREFGKLRPVWLINYILYGYIVVGSQYRGNDGGEGKEEFGGKDINDVLNLIPLLKNDKDVDINRIYMVGYSRGGMMTYLALTKTDKIRSACVIGGISDLFMTEKNRPDMKSVFMDLIGGNSTQLPEEFKRRSAIYYANKIDTPILILHGESDKRVSYLQARKMADELKKYGKVYKLIIYPEGNHSLSNFYWQAFSEQMRWFK